MLVLLERIVKNTLKVYVPAYVIELFFRLMLIVVPDSMLIDTGHALWIMLSATFLVFYSMYDLYLLIFTRTYFFLYTTKYKIQTIFAIYVLVYIVLNMIFYFLYSSFNMEEIPFKFLSVVSFYLLNGFVLLLAKALFSKETGTRVYSIIMFLLVVSLPVLFMFVTMGTYERAVIGSSSPHEFAQQVYVLMVPITVMRYNLSQDFTFYPMLGNLGFGVFSAISLLWVKNKKKNW